MKQNNSVAFPDAHTNLADGSFAVCVPARLAFMLNAPEPG
jgi:hypothetical protein